MEKQDTEEVTCPFIGDFCEVSNLGEGGETGGDGGKGKQLREGTGTLLPALWLFCKLAGCTAQWADVAHIQLDG